MTNKKVNKAAVAGIAGAVIGGAAVAAAVALKDDKTRKKIEGAIDDVKKQAKEYIEAQSDQVDQIKADKADALDKAVDDASDKVKEKAGK